jgi:hypothetical protein
MTFAPIFTTFSRSVVNDHGSIDYRAIYEEVQSGNAHR